MRLALGLAVFMLWDDKRLRFEVLLTDAPFSGFGVIFETNSSTWAVQLSNKTMLSVPSSKRLSFFPKYKS
jgi:hypothetical protein